MNDAPLEPAVLAPPKVLPLVTQLLPAADSVFKDTYLLDFLDCRRAISKMIFDSGS